MNPLRGQFARDLDAVFFNQNEFAETMEINGREMPVVVDSSRLEELKAKSGYADNIFTARLLLFVKAADCGPRPAAETIVTVAGEKYRVVTSSGEQVYRIILRAVRG